MAEETRLSRLENGETNGAQGAEVARIRANIEHTRAAMGDTLNQIQERLSPAHIKEQAKEAVRDATIGRVKKMARNAGDKASDAGRGLVDVVRDNPVPFALIGIGAGWLLMNSRRRGAQEYDYNREQLLTERARFEYEESSGGVREGVSNAAHNVQDRASHVAHTVTDRASDVVHTIREQASEVPHAVSARAHDVADKASDVAHKVGDAASSLGSRVSSRASQARAAAQDKMLRARYQYEETPWMGAAVAIGLGMAAGLAIPGTTREDELMGPRRDELLNRARETARGKIEAVRTVAQEVIQDTRDAATESVREHAREEGLVAEEETSFTGATYRTPGSSTSLG